MKPNNVYAYSGRQNLSKPLRHQPRLEHREEEPPRAPANHPADPCLESLSTYHPTEGKKRAEDERPSKCGNELPDAEVLPSFWQRGCRVTRCHCRF
jgi:hypothetical protein